jgi:hypothetical protein
MYSTGYYENYAPLMYKKDDLYPPPSWMSYDRDYYQILTNNNGDSVAEPWETSLAFNTAEYYDGTYKIFVEAWDEYGNMAVDSQQVVFFNNNISGIKTQDADLSVSVWPNPAEDFLFIQWENSGTEKTFAIYDSKMARVISADHPGKSANGHPVRIDLAGLSSGLYFLVLQCEDTTVVKKFTRK